MDDSGIERLELSSKTITRKHIAERQRRARINSYLEELEALTTPPGIPTGAAKLEKAEVLERAVSFLQQQNLHPGPTTDSNNNEDVSTAHYTEGFQACMSRLLHFTADDKELEAESEGLQTHLVTFIHNLTADSAATDDMDLSSQSNDGYHGSIQSLPMRQSTPTMHQFVQGYDANAANSQLQSATHDMSDGYTHSPGNAQYSGYMTNNCDFNASNQHLYYNTQVQSPHLQALHMMQGYFTDPRQPDDCRMSYGQTPVYSAQCPGGNIQGSGHQTECSDSSMEYQNSVGFVSSGQDVLQEACSKLNANAKSSDVNRGCDVSVDFDVNSANVNADKERNASVWRPW